MNMNNRIVILLLSLVMLSACRKETEVVLDDPDARLTAALKTFQETLVSSPHGWKGTIYPSLRGAYSFYLKFGADNTVTMVGDINATTGKTLRQSTYRLKALQQPTLIFDTYNYLHLLDDPNPEVMGGTRNAGLGSDIEFAFVSSGDTLKVQGIGNKTPFTLVKANEAEAAQYTAGGLETRIKANDDYMKATPYPYLEFVPGQKIQFDLSGKNLGLAYVDNGNVVSTSSYYAFTLNGLYLKAPVKVGNFEFREVLWDEAGKLYYVVVNNTRYNVQSSPTPIIPLHFRFGKGKDFSLITVNPATLTGLSADFMTVYNTAKAGLAAVGGAGRVLDYISITFSDTEDMTFRVYYRNAAGSNFIATWMYKIAFDATARDQVKFTYVSRDNNANVVGSGLVALTNYLEQNEFRLDWFSNQTPGSTALLGGFYKAADPNSFFFGVLSK